MEGKVCGIYKITSKTSGLSYIGQSLDIHRRYYEHISSSKSESTIGKLANAIKTLGEQDFYLEIIEECKEENLDHLENLHIVKQKTYHPHGYNSTYSLKVEPNTKKERKVSVGLYLEKFLFEKVSSDAEERDIPKNRIIEEILLDYYWRKTK